MAWLPRWAIFQQKQEFYRLLKTPLLILLDCRAKEDKWAICRRCLETDKKCSQDPEGCQCENVQVADPSQDDKLIGGSDCSDGFCYISVESSTCSDKWDGFDPNAYYLEDYWHQGSTTDDKLFKSKVACENKEIFNTGFLCQKHLFLH